MLARFQREGRLAVKLKHPHVVRTFEIQQRDDVYFLVMEYLVGETLDDVLTRRTRLPTAEAARLISQALQGAQHIHEQEVVHRDLKPANLMLIPAAAPGQPDTTLQTTVKILDVGLGRTFFDEEDSADEASALTVQGDVIGTPNYMAPEQAKDARLADGRADIYSLGCVLYQCVTGQVPFPEPNVARQILLHATESAKPLSTFGLTDTAALQTVLDRMMAKDPAQRYSTAMEASKALEPFLQCPTAAPAGPQAEPNMPAYLNWLESQDNPFTGLAAAPGGAAPQPAPSVPVATVAPPLQTDSGASSAGPNARRPWLGLTLILLALGGVGVILTIVAGIFGGMYLAGRSRK